MSSALPPLPGSSAIFVAAHSKYLYSMQEFGFVKAFGFGDLLESKNVFQTMGFPGEQVHSFQSFTKENSSCSSHEEKSLIESESVVPHGDNVFPSVGTLLYKTFNLLPQG